MSQSVLVSGGNVIYLGAYVLTSTAPVIVETTVHDGGDGLTKKELAALKKKLRAAQTATDAKRKKAEQRLAEALEAAWAKAHGPTSPKPALEAPSRLIGAVEDAQAVASDIRGQEIAHLRSMIAQGWALVERELQRQRDEQEEEDDVILLLAA